MLLSAFTLVVACTLAFLFGFASTSSSSDELFAARLMEIVALAFALAFAGTFVFPFGFASPGSPPDERTFIAPLTASQASTRDFPSNGGYDPDSIKLSQMPAPIGSLESYITMYSGPKSLFVQKVYEQTYGLNASNSAEVQFRDSRVVAPRLALARLPDSLDPGTRRKEPEAFEVTLSHGCVIVGTPVGQGLYELKLGNGNRYTSVLEDGASDRVLH